MNDGPRYTISVAAELTGMHPQTLRMYDAKGVVSPRRTPGGTRRYSDSDVARLRKVTHLTSVLGLSLSGATHVLALEQTVVELLSRVDALEQQLDLQARRMHQEVSAVHRRYRRDLVARRVLHGHATGAAQDAPELAIPNPPGRVGRRGARNSVQRVGLDGVDELLRLPARRHVAVPAPRADPVRIEPEHAVRDGVRAAKIVEEPAVQLLLLQRGLDTGELLGGQAGRPSGGRGGSRVRGRGRLCDHGGEEQRDHFSFPPDPANPSSRSRNSTLKVVRDP